MSTSTAASKLSITTFGPQGGITDIKSNQVSSSIAVHDVKLHAPRQESLLTNG